MGETRGSRPPRTAFEVRVLGDGEVEAAGPVDVSEEGDVVYVLGGGVLRAADGKWRRPKPNQAAWKAWLADVRAHLAPDAWLGAFDGERLVGLASVRYRLDAPATAQLATLHVGRAYRRQGVGQRLLDASIERALEHGASSMYVSATPSESAVTFYLRHGFEPTADPDPRLLALEPEDIHMIRRLTPSPEDGSR